MSTTQHRKSTHSISDKTELTRSASAIPPVLTLPNAAAQTSEKSSEQGKILPVKEPDSETAAASFNYVSSEWTSEAKISGIIVVAIFVPYFVGWLFGSMTISFAASVLLFLCLNAVWRREISLYKVKARAEIARLHAIAKLVEGGNDETTEWLNCILSRFWLILEPVISDVVTSSVNPILEFYKPNFIDDIALTEFTLGTTSPRLVVVRGNPLTDSDIIRFDVDCEFLPRDSEDLDMSRDERNSKIVLTTRIGRGALNVAVPILVKEVGFSGTLSLQLKTMTGFPYVKLVSLSMPEKPKISFILKPLNGMDLMDTPGLSNFLTKLIDDILGSMFVSPNVFTLDFDAIMNGNSYVTESSIGVLVLKLYEAKDLKNMEAIGLSDPYACVKLGGRVVGKTRVIEDNLNPYWNETFYVLVKNFNDLLELQILDCDILKDKQLGLFKSSLLDLGLDGKVTKVHDIWKPLQYSRDGDVTHSKTKLRGQVRFEMEYYPVVEAPIAAVVAALPDVPKTPLSPTGILRVTIHQAKELDTTRSSSSHFSANVELRYQGHLIHKTKTKKRTNNPSWEESVELFIRNVDKDKIKFTLFEESSKRAIGELDAILKDIVHVSAGKPAVEWWTLRNAASGKVRITFKYQPVPFDHVVAASAEKNMAPAIGTVRIKVIEGHGLKNLESVGKSDPYVVVKYAGRSVAQTHVINDNLDPLYNEVFYVLVHDTSLKGSVYFEVFDYNQLQKDRIMGKCFYDLKQLLNATDGRKPGDIRVVDLPLILDGKQSGTLKLELSYHGIKGDAAAAITGSPPQNSARAAIDLNDSGLVRIELHELELDKEAMRELKFDEKNMPSPYLELFDVASSIYSNDSIMLSESDIMRNKSHRDVDLVRGPLKAELEEPIRLIYRTAAQKTTYSVPELSETIEFFVKDIDASRVLFVLKDFENTKHIDLDESKNAHESFLKHPVLAKVDLNLNSLLEAAHKIQEKAAANPVATATAGKELTDWYPLYSLSPKPKTAIIGKFRLSISFSPVALDPQILAFEYGLEATETGTLTLELIEANDLPAVDSSGTSDPYCNVYVNSEKVYKSKVVKKNNTHPQWNCATQIPLTRRSTSRLTIECRDWNKFEENKLLGQVELDCSRFVLDQGVELLCGLFGMDDERVVGVNGKKSTLKLRYTFVPDEKQLTRSGRHARQRMNMLSKMGSAVGGAMGGAIGNSVVAINLAAKLVAKKRKADKEKSGNNSENSMSDGELGGSSVASSSSVKGTSIAPSSIKSPPESHVELTVDQEAGVKHEAAAAADTLPRRDVSGSEVTGVLIIHIVGATGLKAKDSNGFSDPYLKVRTKSASSAQLRKKPTSSFIGLGSGSKSDDVLYKTKTLKKTLNPVWNESFVVPFDVVLNGAEAPVFVFSLRDHNTIGASSGLGEYTLNVNEAFSHISNYAATEIKVDHVSKKGEIVGGGDGILALKLEFQPRGNLALLNEQYRKLSTSEASIATSVRSHALK